MSKAKEKVIPLGLMAFTSDDYHHLQRMMFMAETMVYHNYMGTYEGEILRVAASIVATKDLEASSDRPEEKEYVKMIKSYKKEFAIQFDLDLIDPVKEEETTEGDIDEL